MQVLRSVRTAYRLKSIWGQTVLKKCNNLHRKNDIFDRGYGTCPPGMKVTICGAAGNTGQPLALLLKQCPLLDEIALYDICATCGCGMELSHVDTKCKVSSYSGKHMLCDALRVGKLSKNFRKCLSSIWKFILPLHSDISASEGKFAVSGSSRKGANVVVIVARNCTDSFENSAPIVTEIALQICNTCPNAFIVVATEPIESMVPLVSEIKRLRSAYNPRMLLGCVELNCVRANTVLADFLRVPPESVRVPVVGGCTPKTMVPILSSAVHPRIMTQQQVECITSCIMCATEVVCAAKCGKETACLAGAYAVARTVINVVKGLQGRKGVLQCAYIDSLGTCAPDCQFFSSEVLLGPSGIEKNLGIPELTKFENCLLVNCLPIVREEIARAVMLVYTMCMQSHQPSSCYSPPSIAICPPTNWTGDGPDPCRDAYLATICREMTCKCGSTELTWRPRDVDYDAARAANITHQLPIKGFQCTGCSVPKSVRIQQEIRDRWQNPCR